MIVLGVGENFNLRFIFDHLACSTGKLWY